MKNLSRRMTALLMAFCLLLGAGVFWNKVSAADISPAAVVSVEETGAYPLHSQKTTCKKKCKKSKKCTCTKKKCKSRKCAYCKAHKACKKNSKHKTHCASHC